MKATKRDGPAPPDQAKTIRGRADNKPRELLTQVSTALADRLTLSGYRTIMATPRWYFVEKAMVITRSYGQGLEAGLRLLEFTHAHRDVLSAAEFERNETHLYLFLLDLLDRADHWHEYLSAWTQIRRHVRYTLTYWPRTPAHAARATPYVVQRLAGGDLRLHFLWWTDHRKAVITRKLDAQRRGRRLGNLRHHPQADLSDAELRRRLAWVARLARAAAGGDPTTGAAADTPPAPAAGATATARASAIEVTLTMDGDQLRRELHRHAAARRPGQTPDASSVGARQQAG